MGKNPSMTATRSSSRAALTPLAILINAFRGSRQAILKVQGSCSSRYFNRLTFSAFPNGWSKVMTSRAPLANPTWAIR